MLARTYTGSQIESLGLEIKNLIGLTLLILVKQVEKFISGLIDLMLVLGYLWGLCSGMQSRRINMNLTTIRL